MWYRFTTNAYSLDNYLCSVVILMIVAARFPLQDFATALIRERSCNSLLRHAGFEIASPLRWPVLNASHCKLGYSTENLCAYVRNSCNPKGGKGGAELWKPPYYH